MNYAKIIKNRIETKEAFSFYGFKPDSRSFVRCPFHNERTPSMKVYEGDRGFHCFGCGEHGDVIAFVQKLFGLNFRDAIRKLDADFRLNLFEEQPFESVRRSTYRQKSMEAKAKREKADKKAADDAYWNAFSEWCRLDRNRSLYKPRIESEELHPLYAEALQKIAYQEYLVDFLDEKRNEYA